MREGIGLVASGIAIGLLLGFGSARVLATLLFGVGAGDPLTFIGAPVLLMLRRWRIPFGSVTFMYALNTLMMSTLIAFRSRDELIVAVLAGLIADVMIVVLKPWNGRAMYFR